MKKYLFYMIIISFLTVISCSDENDAETLATNATIKVENFEVLSGDWNLISVTASEGTVLTPPTEVNIVFSQKENESNIGFLIDGKSSCNLYGGELTSLNDKGISFKQLYSTDMLCENSIFNSFEEDYFVGLFGSDEYLLQGDTLFLLGEFDLEFERTSR
jgi:heat shock protein HslJ